LQEREKTKTKRKEKRLQLKNKVLKDLILLDGQVSDDSIKVCVDSKYLPDGRKSLIKAEHFFLNFVQKHLSNATGMLNRCNQYMKAWYNYWKRLLPIQIFFFKIQFIFFLDQFHLPILLHSLLLFVYIILLSIIRRLQCGARCNSESSLPETRSTEILLDGQVSDKAKREEKQLQLKNKVLKDLEILDLER
jgi:hypothetical protein